MAGDDYGDGVAWIRGSMIGKGSYGRVYHATLKNTSKYSCFPPVMAVKSGEVSVSSSIQKEAEVLANLKGCPNIIEFYGEETTVGPTGVMAYNVLLEYASGGTLADRVKKSGGGGLPEVEAKVYARSILGGLKHIHSLGYVHCDLKPGNILLVEKIGRKWGVGFRAKIGDFGLAKRGRKSGPPEWRGTPAYLSPEAVMDYVQEAPCDVWAVGCIVVEMLTGKCVTDGDGVRDLGALEILRKMGRKGRGRVSIPNGVSEEARGFLERCFVKNPNLRWSAERLLGHEFLQGLEDEDEDEDEEDEELDRESGDEEVAISDEDSLVSYSSSEEDGGMSTDYEVASSSCDVYFCGDDRVDGEDEECSSSSCSGEDDDGECPSSSCSGEDDDEEEDDENGNGEK